MISLSFEQCTSDVFADVAVQLLKEFYKGENPNGKYANIRAMS